MQMLLIYVVLAKFSGIVNLGNTCYLSSVIQSLYHADGFKESLMNMNFQKNSIGRVTQKLFSSLDLGENKAVDPKELVQSCQLDPNVQEDAQEFLLRFIEKLNSDVAEVVNITEEKSPTSSFLGESVQFISCTDIEYTKERRENFYDISVDVTCGKLEDSLLELLLPDTFDGDNKYKTPQNGLQKAIKGQRFMKLPSNLLVHLKRFSFDAETFKLNKVGFILKYINFII